MTLNAEMLGEGLHDLVALVVAQQAVIDEHAGQLVADRLVQQRRDHRRIDTARQAEQHLAITHLLANARDSVGDDVAGRPVARAAADVVYETLHDGLALQGVSHFGMELHAVEMALAIFHRGERRIRAARGYLESRRQRLDAIAVTHPDLEQRRAGIGVAEPAEQVRNPPARSSA